jgi:hypothetical protein
VTLATNVSGLELTLDGQPIDAGTTFTGVAGIVRTLGAAPSQAAGSTIYDFVSWSDGGAATHDVATPDADTTITAIYQERVGASTGPDLTAAIEDDLPAAVIGGQRGRVTVRIANAGPESLSDRVTVRLLLSQDNVVDDGDVELLVTEKKLSLRPGRDKALKLKVEYPLIDDGSYVLLAELDPDNAVAETVESNNVSAAVPVMVQRPVVDLSDTFVTPTPVVIERGKRGAIALTIFNSGNVIARGKVTTALFATPDKTGAGGTQIGTANTSLKLKPGALKNLKVRFTAPIELAAGTYFFAAVLDSTGQIAESDEGNNALVSADAVQVA